MILIEREDVTLYFQDKMYLEGQDMENDNPWDGIVKILRECFDCFHNAAEFDFQQCDRCDLWVCSEHRVYSKLNIFKNENGIFIGEFKEICIICAEETKRN